MATEKAFLQSIWLRAHSEPNGVTVLYPTKNEAVRMRLKLYTAVRDVKADPFLDSALFEAASECEITIAPSGDQYALHVSPSMNNPLLQQAAAQLGLFPDSAPADLDEAESLKRLQSHLDGEDES